MGVAARAELLIPASVLSAIDIKIAAACRFR
jgi:hypothetical protein